ncbi:MAG: hypothetical protein K2Z81_12065, partial [Cyanobacteria bacterium]|nr:hypothetical protein [Cyanobacteriota bacterium]
MIRDLARSTTEVKSKRQKRPLWMDAIGITIILMLVSPYNQLLVDFLLLHPSREECIDQRTKDAIAAKYSVKWSDEWFRSSNGKLVHAWYLKQKQDSKTVLVSHGNAGNISGRAFLLS